MKQIRDIYFKWSEHALMSGIRPAAHYENVEFIDCDFHCNCFTKVTFINCTFIDCHLPITAGEHLCFGDGCKFIYTYGRGLVDVARYLLDPEEWSVFLATFNTLPDEAIWNPYVMLETIEYATFKPCNFTN